MTKEVLCIIYPFSVRTANIQALKYYDFIQLQQEILYGQLVIITK